MAHFGRLSSIDVANLVLLIRGIVVYIVTPMARA